MKTRFSFLFIFCLLGSFSGLGRNENLKINSYPKSGHFEIVRYVGDTDHDDVQPP